MIEPLAERCFHCGLPLPQDEEIVSHLKGERRDFCCHGCQAVCETIFAAGMEGFYERTPDAGLGARPPAPPQELTLYDLDEVQQEFIRASEGSTLRSIHLLVEGIHCAACVWLIERTLRTLPGVVGVAVNLSGKRLHLQWDNSRLALSTVLQKLADIGYSAVPFDPDVAEGRLQKQNRALLFRMAFAGFAMMNLTWISIALYSGADEGEFRSLFHWIGFVLATPTLLYAGWPFLRGAVTGLRHAHLTMDLPIAIGATVTWLYSTYITVVQPPLGEVYFDTVVNFLFVILVGRFLESISKRHAVAATQRLFDLQPKVAIVLDGGEERVTPIRAVKVGQWVLVKPGQKIPVDGVILEGESEVDEAMLSGESLPVIKRCGDSVSAGTLNRLNPLQLEVAATLQQTALGKIITLVEEAQASKAPIQCTADRIVPWFVAATLLLAAITFLYWVGQEFEFALMAATSVLIITCPCAFGLATPMAIAVASGQGAKHGILLKNGAVLERLSQLHHFVFDKTGTLTEGAMRLQKLYLPESAAVEERRIIELAAALEAQSEHPLAEAIIRLAKENDISLKQMLVSDIVNAPGEGMRATVAGHQVVIGTLNWLQQHHISPLLQLVEQEQRVSQQLQTPVHFGCDGEHQALFAIADQLRETAKPLLQRLHRAGHSLTLLSGDRQAVADAVARHLAVPMSVIAEVKPDEKHHLIAQLQQQGEAVVMVGDGINDGPALIQADVGIAMGTGTDVSVESADIVLTDSDLNKIDLATQLAHRTLRTVKQNIAISFSYNIIMVPLAMAGFITPLVAAISMPISSLLVIGNAARIRTLFSGK
ncbi:heavy metal translocating P-type ATPase [Ectothiorhodospiraceae bacterium BW-2]|nr:heavy metal translocating P-type ATPase [Ectothiorhodospiraceae bacterium BW-2]